ncbi:substrate-binding domain-containing protein [Treponema sp. OttesenSCG-928-L16]|nr:substrate-binding domain-containing protein [Treponema sp. OttesenSCG-928-L16]
MKKNTARIILLCLGFCMFAGCGGKGGTEGKETRVVFIPKLTGNAFFEAANKGAQAYAAKQGFIVDYQGSSRASIDDQIAIIKKAVEGKADAICISALDAAALDAVMKEALAAGVKAVTWDSDVSGDARIVMVSQGTPEQLGTMLVEMGAKSLAARGKDPTAGAVRYVWHYSQEIVADQNSWNKAGEAYIRAAYPNWVNLAPDNYYSRQDPELALSAGKEIFQTHPDIDLIICNDSTSLPGQARAAQELGLSAGDVSITGFASPNAMREYCKAGIVERWGLWDCQVQGALGCYLAYYLAQGNNLRVGDKIDVPDIGVVTVMPNTVLDTEAYTAQNSGVVLLPSRSEYTIKNVDDYDF